jgi:hypothetical protein
MIISILIFIACLVGLGGLVWGIVAYQNNQKTLDAKFTDAEAIELAMQNGGELSAALLIREGLSSGEAQQKLNQLLMHGVLTQRYDWKSFESRYVLAGKQQATNPAKLDASAKTTSLSSSGKRSLPDAEVIQLAVANSGRLTASALCLKANVSVDEAKAKLDELYRKEIFTLDVSDTGTLTYALTDRDLLG